MPDLVERLARLIAQDNAVLFVGAELRQGEGESSTIAQIARALAGRIEYGRTDLSLPAVARDYEVLKGRAELILALREELEKLGDSPSAVHELLADAVLPTTKVITTRFDHVIEESLQSHSKPYVLIVRDTDVPFFDESKVTLIKIQGDIGQPESLVITEDDLEVFISNLPTVGDVIRAYFATKTLIFIGYDLNSPVFKRLYRQVSLQLSAFRREAYAILPKALDDVETKYWESQNVVLTVEDPAQFLTKLGAAVKDERAGAQPVESAPLLRLAHPPLPERPYKALDSFTGDDAAIFSGRAEESDRLTNRILAHRLTVVYGESGSGKTSLLQAGVRPRLAARGALLAVAQVAAGQPFEAALMQALSAAAEAADVKLPESDELKAGLRRLQEAVGGPVVLVLDQFEQLFLGTVAGDREAAAGRIDELSRAGDLNLRLVVVLREDFLGRLQSLEGRVPGLLDVRFRLEHLGREAARAAIEEPAHLFGVRWDPVLVERLLDDLYEGAGGGVAPPQLQIVCDRLYEEVTADAPTREGGGEVVIGMDAFEALGGTQGILGDYLEKAIGALPEEQRPVARRLLGALVSSGGLKQRLRLEDLARAADAAPEAAAGILDELTGRRLLRRLETEPGGEGEQRLEYELTHDYLARRIVRWLGDDFWAGQKARELVRESLPEWMKDGRLPAPGDVRLAALHEGRVRFSDAEAEMLYAGSVAYEDDPGIWEKRLAPEVCRSVLLRLLDNEEANARRRAAARLAAYGEVDVANALATRALKDVDPDVRAAAALSIARQGQAGAAEVSPAAVSLLAVAAGDPASRGAALEALARIRDRRAGIETILPPPLRGPVRRATRSMRLRRERDRIATSVRWGALGGYLGIGIALGMLFSGVNQIMQTARALQIVFFVVALIATGILGALLAAILGLSRSLLFVLQDKIRPWLNWVGAGVLAAFLTALVLALVPLPGDEGNSDLTDFLGFFPVFLLPVLGASLPWRRARPRHALAGLLGALAWVGLAGEQGAVLLLSGFASGLIMSIGFERLIEHEADLKAQRDRG